MDKELRKKYELISSEISEQLGSGYRKQIQASYQTPAEILRDQNFLDNSLPFLQALEGEALQTASDVYKTSLEIQDQLTMLDQMKQEMNSVCQLLDPLKEEQEALRKDVQIFEEEVRKETLYYQDAMQFGKGVLGLTADSSQYFDQLKDKEQKKAAFYQAGNELMDLDLSYLDRIVTREVKPEIRQIASIPMILETERPGTARPFLTGKRADVKTLVESQITFAVDTFDRCFSPLVFSDDFKKQIGMNGEDIFDRIFLNGSSLNELYGQKYEDIPYLSAQDAMKCEFIAAISAGDHADVLLPGREETVNVIPQTSQPFLQPMIRKISSHDYSEMIRRSREDLGFLPEEDLRCRKERINEEPEKQRFAASQYKIIQKKKQVPQFLRDMTRDQIDSLGYKCWQVRFGRDIPALCIMNAMATHHLSLIEVLEADQETLDRYGKEFADVVKRTNFAEPGLSFEEKSARISDAGTVFKNYTDMLLSLSYPEIDLTDTNEIADHYSEIMWISQMSKDHLQVKFRMSELPGFAEAYGGREAMSATEGPLDYCAHLVTELAEHADPEKRTAVRIAESLASRLFHLDFPGIPMKQIKPDLDLYHDVFSFRTHATEFFGSILAEIKSGDASQEDRKYADGFIRFLNFEGPCPDITRVMNYHEKISALEERMQKEGMGTADTLPVVEPHSTLLYGTGKEPGASDYSYYESIIRGSGRFVPAYQASAAERPAIITDTIKTNEIFDEIRSSLGMDISPEIYQDAGIQDVLDLFYIDDQKASDYIAEHYPAAQELMRLDTEKKVTPDSIRSEYGNLARKEIISALLSGEHQISAVKLGTDPAGNYIVGVTDLSADDKFLSDISRNMGNRITAAGKKRSESQKKSIADQVRSNVSGKLYETLMSRELSRDTVNNLYTEAEDRYLGNSLEKGGQYLKARMERYDAVMKNYAKENGMPYDLKESSLRVLADLVLLGSHDKIHFADLSDPSVFQPEKEAVGTRVLEAFASYYRNGGRAPAEEEVKKLLSEAVSAFQKLDPLKEILYAVKEDPSLTDPGKIREVLQKKDNFPVICGVLSAINAEDDMLTYSLGLDSVKELAPQKGSPLMEGYRNISTAFESFRSAGSFLQASIGYSRSSFDLIHDMTKPMTDYVLTKEMIDILAENPSAVPVSGLKELKQLTPKVKSVISASGVTSYLNMDTLMNQSLEPQKIMDIVRYARMGTEDNMENLIPKPVRNQNAREKIRMEASRLEQGDDIFRKKDASYYKDLEKRCGITSISRNATRSSMVYLYIMGKDKLSMAEVMKLDQNTMMEKSDEWIELMESHLLNGDDQTPQKKAELGLFYGKLYKDMYDVLDQEVIPVKDYQDPVQVAEHYEQISRTAAAIKDLHQTEKYVKDLPGFYEAFGGQEKHDERQLAQHNLDELLNSMTRVYDPRENMASRLKHRLVLDHQDMSWLSGPLGQAELARDTDLIVGAITNVATESYIRLSSRDVPVDKRTENEFLRNKLERYVNGDEPLPESVPFNERIDHAIEETRTFMENRKEEGYSPREYNEITNIRLDIKTMMTENNAAAFSNLASGQTNFFFLDPYQDAEMIKTAEVILERSVRSLRQVIENPLYQDAGYQDPYDLIYLDGVSFKDYVSEKRPEMAVIKDKDPGRYERTLNAELAHAILGGGHVIHTVEIGTLEDGSYQTGIREISIDPEMFRKVSSEYGVRIPRMDPSSVISEEQKSIYAQNVKEKVSAHVYQSAMKELNRRDAAGYEYIRSAARYDSNDPAVNRQYFDETFDRKLYLMKANNKEKGIVFREDHTLFRNCAELILLSENPEVRYADLMDPEKFKEDKIKAGTRVADAFLTYFNGPSEPDSRDYMIPVVELMGQAMKAITDLDLKKEILYSLGKDPEMKDPEQIRDLMSMKENIPTVNGLLKDVTEFVTTAENIMNQEGILPKAIIETLRTTSEEDYGKYQKAASNLKNLDGDADFHTYVREYLNGRSFSMEEQLDITACHAVMNLEHQIIAGAGKASEISGEEIHAAELQKEILKNALRAVTQSGEKNLPAMNELMLNELSPEHADLLKPFMVKQNVLREQKEQEVTREENPVRVRKSFAELSQSLSSEEEKHKRKKVKGKKDPELTQN